MILNWANTLRKCGYFQYFSVILQKSFRLIITMYKIKSVIYLLLFVLMAQSCKKTDDVAPRLIIRFAFNPTQERLNGLGQASPLAAGNAGQSPHFRSISAHYVELSPTMFTPLGSGEIIYKNPETTAGGDNAIDFAQAKRVAENEIFLSIPLGEINPGTYQYLRISLSYQNYDIDVTANDITVTGTLASFIGFNTYVQEFDILNQSLAINDNVLQGFWAFESPYGMIQGQIPPGGVTVPNPIFSTSPIPQGSCVVTAAFDTPLIIDTSSDEDITITASLSTNHSFEWQDANANGLYEPLLGETVVDMGIRGMIPVVE